MPRGDSSRSWQPVATRGGSASVRGLTLTAGPRYAGAAQLVGGDAVGALEARAEHDVVLVTFHVPRRIERMHRIVGTVDLVAGRAAGPARVHARAAQRVTGQRAGDAGRDEKRERRAGHRDLRRELEPE